MRPLGLLLLLVVGLVWPAAALADTPVATKKGVAVVATEGASDAAWGLAQKIYASPLRPPAIDDAQARVLAGENAPSPELAELIELRSGVKGEDAASRQLLAAIADRLSASALVVVFSGGENQPPVARVFHADNVSFDAARYSPDASGGWNGTVDLLTRQFAPPPPAPTAPPPKTAAKASNGPDSKPFWQSPWFWVAIGTAVLVGAGVLIATNVQTSDTIHLQLRMP